MVDYKTFKKEYLNEWVDRSQAARKAAEELANKEVRAPLQDKYASMIKGLVFELDGKMLEFKDRNEENLAQGRGGLFTWDEAMKRFGKPDEDGWRLPTKEELYDLADKNSFKFKDSKGVFDNRLVLPACGYHTISQQVMYVGDFADYWSSTPEDDTTAWYLRIDQGGVTISYTHVREGLSVRLVREIL